MDFPFPIMLCDIGGTNARFALKSAPGASLLPGPPIKTADYPSFEAALSTAFLGFAAKPRSVIACAAGPVFGRSAKLTNAAWEIDGEAVARELSLDQGLLLNDFEAQALTLPVLEHDWTTHIGPPVEATPGVRLVIGVGTGLGAAALVEVEGRYLALASEAGHVDFAPVGAVEAAIWPHIRMSDQGRISAETILSGHGIARLHQARCAAAGLTPPALDEIGVVRDALAAPDGEEARTLGLIWMLVARCAGDLTLNLLAKGGVTFSGGVLPRLTAFLDPAQFRARFEDKAPFGEMMKQIGTRLVIANEVVLPGMAAVAVDPDRYIIDYATRAWR
ncbi:glucokinase [Methylocella silvestris]|nr:glucokinase [Methylocella silvestris]